MDFGTEVGNTLCFETRISLLPNSTGKYYILTGKVQFA